MHSETSASPGCRSRREKISDRRRDLLSMRFQCEVASIEEADDRIRNVAPERLGTQWQEKGIVLAPDRQEGRPVRPEVVLEGRVKSDIALVVAEQVQLDLIGAGAGQIEVVERIAVRGNGSRVGNAVGVLPSRRLGAQEGSER